MNVKQFLIWPDFATYRGEGFSSARHSHFYIQISLPDSGHVELRTRGGEWQSYKAAFIPSAVSHEMRKVDGDLTLIYLDPLTTGFGLFADRMQTAFDVGDLIDDDMKRRIKMIIPSANLKVRPAILEILNPLLSQSTKNEMDARIKKSISNADLETFSLAELAENAGLSTERFRHLFRSETGVAFSGYRLWLKTKKAVDTLANRLDLLDATYEGGFADQAHFSRIFRRSFGVNPSDFTKRKDPFTAHFFSA